MESAIKVVVLIVGGTIAISLLTSQSFGANAGAVGNAIAGILTAMRGGATTSNTNSPQGPQPGV